MNDPVPGRVSAALARARAPARLAYLAILLLATLSALRLDLDPAAIADRLRRALHPEPSGSDIVDGARNVVLFAGWGLVWMVTAAPGRARRALVEAVVTGGALSLFVEGCQLLSDTRTPSLLDLATNTGGSLLGALLLAAGVIAVAGLGGARSFVGLPTAIFATSYAIAVSADAFVPLFRQELQIGVAGGPSDRIGTVLSAFRWDTVADPPVADFLLFLPAGALAVAALREHGHPYTLSALLVVAGGVVAMSGLEVLHGALGIAIHGGALWVHVAAVSAGALAAARWLPGFTRAARGARRARHVTSAYAGVLALWALRPYAPELGVDALLDKLTSPWWVPLRSLGMTRTMFSVVDVFGGFFLYLPLGAMLAVWPLRARGLLGWCLPAVYLAVVTELAQIFVRSRMLDVTDLLVQAAGAAVGWVVVRRAGLPVRGVQLD